MSRYQEVKKATDKMDSNAYALWRSNPENREDIALLDSGAQAPVSTERYAVLRPCFNCRRDVPTASDFQGQIFCSDKCKKELGDSTVAIRKVFADFKAAEPNFYECPYNNELLINTWREVGAANPRFNWNVNNAKLVFDSLTAEGRLLPHISVKEINAMTADQYNERLRVDPNLGGHIDKIDKKEVLATSQQRNEHPELPKVATDLEFQDARNAVNRKAQAAIANHANRFNSTQFKNGVPVEAPTTSNLRVFRNGRPVN